mmetsp:Transcript_20839/g.50131  ORF Transcript_20839/g.50131 Transcript_20839/m.50131 type:complete len:569 (-) Transcript_20839:44-1750(-)
MWRKEIIRQDRKGWWSAFWNWLIFLLVCPLCDIDLGCLPQPVHAANGGNPSTVRPIPKPTPGRSPLSPRVPFLPFRNSRRAAKEAYLRLLQNELDSAQRQLYVSQNTCSTLRKRWEDQRKETLGLIASRTQNGIRDSNLLEEEQQKILDQKDEINQLQDDLRVETEKYTHQVEKFDLLSAELKELQVWKENEEKSSRGKLLEYEQRLQNSNQKRNDYVEQVQLLTLKLEAAELVAKQNQWEEGGGTESTQRQRTHALRSELESVRVKYSKLLVGSINAPKEGGQKHQLEEEMDNAIQSAIGSVLEATEKDWLMRYEMLEDQLKNMTEYATTLIEEKDAALNQVQEALSSSPMQPDQEQDPANLSKEHKKKIREDLVAELTETLTDELTEKLTAQLTDTLAEKIEKKYKKKLKRLRQELKEQQQNTSEEKQSQDDMIQQQQQQQEKIEEEIRLFKDQYEREYETKFQRLQKQNEEQVQLQKERMRKLVRALLDRESKQKGVNVTKKQGAVANDKKIKASPKRKKKKIITDNGEATDKKGNGDEFVTASLSSTRKNTLSTPGAVPVHRNR